MTITAQPPATWSPWQRPLFRFFFIYSVLFTAPWTWFGVIPGISYLVGLYYQAIDWIVNLFNKNVFHIKDELVPLNGSGDTSFGWAEVCTYLLIAFAGMVIWSIAGRKRKEYIRLKYWLCLVVRYNIALVCFNYGFIKIFGLQMLFPTYSQMATPLGDFLPMRLSWMFMGYSHLYQGFSGTLEVVAGLLLLYRRTTALGSLMAAGVFLNVAMLNVSYDIPVKLFSIQTLLMCLFLLIVDHKRLLDFFVRNSTAAPSVLYEYTPSKRWMRISKTVMKLGMIALSAGFSLYQAFNRYQSSSTLTTMPPLQAGLYDVTTFTVNNVTFPPTYTDSLRWQNIAIENNGWGSIGTSDTLFWRRYNRSYFLYEPDTSKHVIVFRNYTDPAAPSLTFAYELADSNTVHLRGRRGPDSLFLVLAKSRHRFQLGEKQFHWLSESNR